MRPILSENCFKCHGFDPKKREAGRRIDTREGALAENEGVRAVVPGKLGESELHVRIRSTDADEQMPPPKSGKKLNDRQRAILDRWIEQGAEYQPHWAYAPLARPAVPGTMQAGFSKNPIDAFVLERQQQLGLQHVGEADARTLVRRLHLDLAGLPPTSAEVEAFVHANPATAAEQEVDRLLASPAFGERMAVYWLDVVRYADSIGYHSDNPRNVSPYRDYVIRAFNENQRFDQFTIEQVAGDLLPEPTRWQRVASGFNRLTETTEEGGAQAKDYEARSVTDRVRAIGTVWLAQTTGCCQCHDHKFDPITARDFYRLGAFFADIKESAIGKREEGMPVPTPDQEARLSALGEKLSTLTAKRDAPSPELDAAQAAWERSMLETLADPADWKPLHPVEMTSAKGATLSVEAEEIIRSAGESADPDVFTITVPTGAEAITGFRLEALASSRLPNHGPGRSAPGNFVLTEFSAATPEGPLALAKATATFEQKGYPASAAIDGKTGEKKNGWAISGGGIGLDQSIYFQLAQPLVREGGGPVTFTLRFDYGELHTLGKFRLAMTSTPGPIVAPGTGLPAEIVALLKVETSTRTDAQRADAEKAFPRTRAGVGAAARGDRRGRKGARGVRQNHHALPRLGIRAAAHRAHSAARELAG